METVITIGESQNAEVDGILWVCRVSWYQVHWLQNNTWLHARLRKASLFWIMTIRSTYDVDFQHAMLWIPNRTVRISKLYNHQEFVPYGYLYNMNSRLIFIRHRLPSSRRAYSTPARVKLAFDLHEPTKGSHLQHAPIIFMHGLFGSKKNNRGMSKWATLVQIYTDLPLTPWVRALARDLGRAVYAVVSSIPDLESFDHSDLILSRTFETMMTPPTIQSMTICPWQTTWRGS